MTDQKDTIDAWFEDPAMALDIARSMASTAWEIDFIEQQIARYEQYGDRMFMSGRQADTIKRIARLG